MNEPALRTSPLLLGSECRYRLVRRIGSGGFGEVWLVENASGERYAAKLLLPEVSDHDAVQERFLREIRTGVRLDHPHVIKVVDAGWLRQTRQAFFVMEFVDGAALDHLRFNLVALLEMMRQLLTALAYSHARGVVHRDIKPDNVLVARKADGFHVKLVDFGIAMVGDGIAQKARRNLTQPGAPMGTLAYMSPEQASGEPSSVGPASDLYSLGIALYECLAGRTPFSGKGLSLLVKHCAHLPPDLVPREGMPDPLPPALVELVSSLLLKRYNDRPHFAAEVQGRLTQVLDALRQAGGPGSAAWVEWPEVEREGRATDLEPAQPELATSETIMPSPGLSQAEAEDVTMASMEPGAPGSILNAIHEPASAVVRVRAALAEGEPIQGERKPLHRLRQPPLVGRDEERAVLTRAVQRVLRERGSFSVLIRGEVGVGKSRLGRWLAEEVHQRGAMQVLRVNLADHDGLPGAMHNAFYRTLRMPRLERRPVLERIEDVLEMTGEMATQLANFLLWEVSAHTTSRATGEFDRQVEAWPRLWLHVMHRIQRMTGEQRPLMIWLDGPDDVGQAAQVRGWATFMAKALERQSQPFLFVWTVRNEALQAEGWGEEHFETIEIRPLPPREEALLLSGIAPTLAPRAVAELGLRTRGNPLFVAELLWGLVDSGDLLTAGDFLDLSERARAEATVSLDDVLRRQVALFLDHVTDRERVTIGLAALAFMGATFPPDQIEAVFTGTKVTTEDLISYGIVTARLLSRDARLALTSTSLRDLLLEHARTQGIATHATSLAVSVRIQGAITALIRSDWDDAEQSLRYLWGLLAQVEIEGAEQYRLAVLDLMALTSFRRREAALVRGCAQGILQLRDRATTPEATHRLSAAGHFWLGKAHYVENAFQDALVEFALAEDEATRAGDRHRTAEILHAKAVVCTEQGDVEEGSRLSREAYDVVREVLKAPHLHAVEQMLQLLEADIVGWMGHQRQQQGELVAAAALQRRVLRVFSELGDRQGEAHTQLALSRNLRSLGDREGAQRHRERARQLLEALDDRRGRALLAWEDAAALLKGGHPDDADRMFLEASQLFTTIHDKVSAAAAVNGRGEAARRARRYNDAVACYLEFRDAMREFGLPHGEGLAHINLGWTLLEAGEPVRALGQFDAAREVLTEETPRMVRVDARIGQALTRLRLDDAIGAYSALDDAVTVAEGNKVADEDSQRALEVLRDTPPDVVDLAPLARRLLGASA